LTTTSADRSRRASPLAIVEGFVPWIVYWILIGSVSFRTAVLVAFALSLALNALSWVRGSRPKTLEIGTAVVFLILTVITFATNDHFLERWIQPLSNFGLFAVALGSVLVGRPFTLEYAREAVDEETARLPGFVYINRVITLVWVAAFAVMTIASFVPPIVEGDSTIKEGGSTLSILGYWVVPFTVLGLAGIFSSKFPDWFTRGMARLDAEADAPPAGAPVTLERIDEPRAGDLELSVEPRRALADEPWTVTVTGAPPGEPVEVETETVDMAGRAWRAAATLRADDRGTATPEDPMALLWDMTPADGEPPDLFVAPPEAMAVNVRARVNGTSVGVTAARLGGEPGLRVSEIHDDRVTARLFLPPRPGTHPAVAVFHGSEGGLDSQSGLAALLASHGFAAMVIAFSGAEGLPDHVVEVPLERFADGIRRLAAHPEVAAERVGAMAISKGSEGLLAAAARIGDLPLRGVVAVSPSSRTWQGIGEHGPEPDRSSWTLRGEPLPFAPIAGDALMPELLRNVALERLDRRRHRPTLLHLAVGYDLGAAAPKGSSIEAERIAAPLLLLAGEADELWPSSAMAAELAARREGRDGDDSVAYPDAGHLLRFPYQPTAGLWTSGVAFGGTAPGLAAAQADLGPRVLAFLR
jgi:dienelactone hydrolase